jgi:hypothetical protein
MAAVVLMQSELAVAQATTAGKHPAPAERRRPSAESAAKEPPIRRGEHGTLTLRIAGTTKSTRVTVRNKNSAIVTLDVGDEQTVMSSGGETNSVTLTLTGVSPGQPDFELTVDNDDLPTVFRKTLRQIVMITRKRLASLETLAIPPGRVTYKLDDVLDVLNGVERDVVTLLPENEFAAFRDAMHTYIAKLRARISERAIALPRGTAAGVSAVGIVRVSNQFVQFSQRADKSTTDTSFGDLFGLLEKTATDGLNREICVRTMPTRYDISLTPNSYSAGAKFVNADSLMSLTVGEYKVRIPAKGKNLESNTTVDFLTNPYFVIECPVKFADGDAEACKYLAGESRPCP